MENLALKRWEPYRIFFMIMNWIFWNALAITTGVMVYSAADRPVYERFGPEWHFPILSVIIIGIYVMVDYGLAPKLKAWMRDRGDLAKPVRGAGEEVLKEYKAERTLFRVILLFLILRVFATGLSSIWAGSEIGGMMNSGDSTKEFRVAVAQKDSMDAARLAIVDKQFREAADTESGRVAAAVKKGDAEILAAIRRGNPDQQAMYRKNSNFFKRLSPTSQWTPGNKRFIDRVNRAKINKAAYIAAAKGDTEKAEKLLAGVVQDTSGSAFAQVMAVGAQAALNGQITRTARHTNLIIGIDWFCLIGGLFCTWVLVRIEKVTKRLRDTRTVAWAFLTWMHHNRIRFLNWVEELFEIDIDGDGTIGGHPPAEIVPVLTSPTTMPIMTTASTSRTVVQPFQPGGYKYGADVTPTLPADNLPPAASPPKMPGTPLANAGTPLANTLVGHAAIEADTARRAYRNAKSNWHSWKNHSEKVKSPEGKRNAEKHMVELAQVMDKNLRILDRLGVELNPPKKRKRAVTA